jgi:hypothetical protein
MLRGKTPGLKVGCIAAVEPEGEEANDIVLNEPELGVEFVPRPLMTK